MRSDNQRKRRRVRAKELSRAYRMELEVREFRWQVSNLLEQRMIDPDEYIRLAELINVIDDHVKEMVAVVSDVRKKLRWQIQ